MMSKYENGGYDDSDGDFDFGKMDLTNEFLEATINVLIDENLGKRAEKILDLMQLDSKKRNPILKKLHRRADVKDGKIIKTVKGDQNKLEVVNKKIKEKAKGYQRKAKSDLIKQVILKEGENEMNGDGIIIQKINP